MNYSPKSTVSNQSSSRQSYLVANNCTAEEFVATLERRQTTASFSVVLMNEYKYFTQEDFLGTLDKKFEEHISASLDTFYLPITV